MSTDAIQEARRQIEICNACRYCEGFCSVFPAMTRDKVFADGDVSHLANLCHNCRGCYYSCQYTEPHVFALNLPAALAEVRQDSWERHAWPRALAGPFHKNGLLVAAAFVVALTFLIGALKALAPAGGEGFYAVMAHGTMVAIFAPAFLLPLAAIAVSLRRYWREVGGAPIRWSEVAAATRSAGQMRNLDGGQGQGCNFEHGDRYSNSRRWAHQAVLYGFLLCFASTAAATLLHYILGMEAPYGFLSIPKLLGVPGGVLLTIGTAALAYLKLRADPELGAVRVWGGEMGFIALLFAVAVSGLALYAATGTGLVPFMLALHLATVLTFFLLMPYSKMVHGFYRFLALIAEAQKTQAKHVAVTQKDNRT